MEMKGGRPQQREDKPALYIISSQWMSNQGTPEKQQDT